MNIIDELKLHIYESALDNEDKQDLLEIVESTDDIDVLNNVFDVLEAGNELANQQPMTAMQKLQLKHKMNQRDKIAKNNAALDKKYMQGTSAAVVDSMNLRDRIANKLNSNKQITEEDLVKLQNALISARSKNDAKSKQIQKDIENLIVNANAKNISKAEKKIHADNVKADKAARKAKAKEILKGASYESVCESVIEMLDDEDITVQEAVELLDLLK